MSFNKKDYKHLDSFHEYPNGDWRHKDKDGYWHIVRNNKELTEGIKATAMFCHYNGTWHYKEDDETWHEIKGDKDEV